MKLPKIPSHWSWKTVSQLGGTGRPAVKAGPFGSSLKKEFYVESGFRVYGQEQVIAGNLSIGDYYIDKEKFETLKACEVKAGDILISLVGTFGKVLVVPDIFEPGIINPRLVRLSLNPKLIDPYFFCRFFRSPLAQTQMSLQSHGGTMDILNAKNISELFVPLPPLEEQRRIAAILDKADAVRRKRKEAIALTEELLRSAFLDMFGDPVTNPKGWDIVELYKLLTFITTGSRGWAKFYASEGRLFLRIQNVKDGKLLLEDVAYVNPPDSAEARRTRVQEGDVLLSMTADLGRTAVIPKGLQPAYINQHLAILRLNQKLISPFYLAAFLSSVGGRLQITRLNREGVKAGLNFDDVKSLHILLPPINMQKKYEDFCKHQTEILSQYKQSSDAAQNLFNSLLQKAFRGEL
jgi:type I restriction enzyme, S subunit